MADPLISNIVQQHMPVGMTDSLNSAVDASPNALPPDVSPAFLHADQFTAVHEGGITKDDGNKHAAAFGVDQNAHPNLDVANMSAEKAQAIRYEYWRAIGGDDLAKKNSALATSAYDTAIMSGPDRAQQFLKGAGDDPNKFMQERSDFFHKLEKSPTYARATPGWEARNEDLKKEIRSSVVSASVPPSQKQAQSTNKYPKKSASNNQTRLKNLFT